MTFADDFFMNYETLKLSENWEDLITLGHNALNEGLDSQNNALINSRLASSLFYLGKKQEALDSATYAFGNASFIQNKELEARSLYLISAAHRALGAKEEAFAFIHDALQYVGNEEVGQITKLKIFFNSGALYQDLNHNPIKAKEYYAQALEVCKELTDEDDCNRTSIRSIRATLEQGDPTEANKEAEELETKINLNNKTGVHFLQLKSKIAFALNDYLNSCFYASQGFNIATAKQMRTEIKMFNVLLENCKDKDDL